MAPGPQLIQIRAHLRLLGELFDFRGMGDEGVILGDLSDRLERVACEIAERAQAAGLDEQTLLPTAVRQ